MCFLGGFWSIEVEVRQVPKKTEGLIGVLRDAPGPWGINGHCRDFPWIQISGLSGEPCTFEPRVVLEISWIICIYVYKYHIYIYVGILLDTTVITSYPLSNMDVA